VNSVSEAIDVMCPKASTLCDSYMEIPPAIMVNTPINNREIQPDITASFEFANFQVRVDSTSRCAPRDIRTGERGTSGKSTFSRIYVA
jgi:hypothetical protein